MLKQPSAPTLNMLPAALVLGTGLCLAFSIGAFLLRLASADGAAALMAVTLGGYLGFGFAGLWYLAAIFVLSSAVTKFHYSSKKSVGSAETQGGARNAWKIFGGAGLAGVVGWGMYLHLLPLAITGIVFSASIATTNADTWASELGVLSRKPPHRILPPWDEVNRGDSGGISPVGEAAAVVGAIAASLVAAALGLSIPPLLGGLACFGGALAAEHFDSVLGASLQVLYRCPECGRISEKRWHHKGVRGVRTRGWFFLSNEGVNLVSSCFGAAIAFGLLAVLN